MLTCFHLLENLLVYFLVFSIGGKSVSTQPQPQPSGLGFPFGRVSTSSPFSKLLVQVSHECEDLLSSLAPLLSSHIPSASGEDFDKQRGQAHKRGGRKRAVRGHGYEDLREVPCIRFDVPDRYLVRSRSRAATSSSAAPSSASDAPGRRLHHHASGSKKASRADCVVQATDTTSHVPGAASWRSTVDARYTLAERAARGGAWRHTTQLISRANPCPQTASPLSIRPSHGSRIR